MKPNLPRLDTSNLWDQTYSLLKERIIRREFAPNQKLIIPELAGKLGISRTPIRDALTRLEMDGLVRTVSKVGTFVTPITVKDVNDIMETRIILEHWAIDKFFQLPQDKTELLLDKMERLLTEAEQALEQLIDTYYETDYNLMFHMELIQIGDNQKNNDIYLNLMNYRFITVGTSLVTKQMGLDACSQHREIVQALREGNCKQAKQQSKAHIEDSRNRLLVDITANGGFI